jgi:hypothetical protein
MATARSMAGGPDRAKPVLRTQLIYGDVRSGACLTILNHENPRRVADRNAMSKPVALHAVGAFSREDIVSPFWASIRCPKPERPEICAGPSTELSS